MKKIIIATIIVTSLILGGCSSNSSSTKTTINPSTSSNTTTKAKDMTLKELAKYDGQNGNPAYVAVNGVIYDVSNEKEWQNGIHKNGVKAGLDQSNMIGQSPHGTSVLKKLPVIGKLKIK